MTDASIAADANAGSLEVLRPALTGIIAAE